MPPVIIDTNVVVAGLLTRRPDSPVARILDGMLGAAFPFVLSEALLAEYRAVLLRPRIARAHGLAADEIDALLTQLAQHAIVLAPSGAAPPAPDAGDQLLWDLLACRTDLMLVSGDAALLDAVDMRPRIVSPADWLARGTRAGTNPAQRR